MEQESHTLPFLGKTRCEEDEQSPVEQVALTVPTTDDIEMPVVTFRMWTLGTISCVILSFMNQFFWYRNESLTITALSAQIAVLPLGRLMAKTLTKRKFFQGSRYEFSLNPGPFNMKEHVLITIFANAGAGGVYAIDIITAIKVFYKKELSFFVAFLVVITTQIIGFGWAGIFRKYLVEPSAMWWPENLVQVSLFRALHEEEKRPKRGLTRNQFFIIAVTCSFAYYVIPGYLIPMFTCASWICWLFPTSIIAQQIGSGLNGLGLGAIGLDWATISSYLGSPLATPWFAIVNVAVGFTLIIYLVTPLAYWLNIYDARKYPIFSKELFTSQGQVYNISMIIDSNFQLDHDVYKKYGPLHLSTLFAMTYGFGFAALAATIVHVLLFHGKEIWHLKSSFRTREDIHTKLMRKYKQVPQSWFLIVLIASITLAIFSCEYYIDQLQLPWWGVLLACAIAIFFTLPIGVITATTNQSPGLNIISEYIIGYIYPERPVANICFKVYGWFSVIQSITFLQDFKLGHYLKIPPRAMYMAQMVGAVIASIVYLGTAWWMMNSVPNLCDSTLLAPNNHWTCPTGRVFYDASVIWGLIGPRRIFGSAGTYNAINWFFLVGAIAPFLVWLAHKKFPNKEWIKQINMPVLIGAIAVMPIATPVNYTSWLIMGFVFNFLIYRYRKKWWIRHNYVLSGALDVGLGFMAIVLYLCLELNGISFRWWGDRLDQCPLASCPTSRGVVVEGCPSFLD